MKLEQREILFAGLCGLAAAAAILAMPHLVAPPKLLLGRSLSAIPPSLFPYITLALIALLSVPLVVLSAHSAKTATQQTLSVDVTASENKAGLIKTCLFFVLLTGYGLLLKPAGFLISSFLAISATSLMLGNKNWLQILLLAILAPICLYLLATRIMLVALPELNQIELWYADAIDWVKSRIAP